MKIFFRYFFCVIFLITSANLFADYFILTDGVYFKGIIESQDQVNTVIIKDGSGEKLTVKSESISKKITKPVFIEKLIIYLTDNTTIEGYCVDYDQYSYTVRKELNRPDELKIQQKDILYAKSRLNPSGVSFELSAGTMKLKWISSLEKVKLYKVYYRKKSDSYYKQAGETDKLEYIVPGLEAGTEYEVIVRGVTPDGFEALPGQMTSLTTVNIPPDKPGSVSIKGESGSKNIVISWGRSNDRDGTVKGYNIYKKTVKGYEKIGTTEKTEYSFKTDSLFSGISFLIKAVDNIGLESDGAESDSWYSQHYEVKLDVGYMIPIGDLADLFESGLSCQVSFGMNDIYLRGLSFGAQTGYMKYSSGKEYNASTYDSFLAVPLLLNAGYSYPFMVNYRAQAAVGMGYCYAAIDYTRGNGNTVSAVEITPAVLAGISASYIYGNFNAGAGISYSSIIEKDRNLESVILSISAGYKF